MDGRLKVDATLENLVTVNSFVEEKMEEAGCSMKLIMQMNLVVEEIYVNIVHYAYGKLDPEGNIIPDTGTGPAEIIFDSDDQSVRLTFIDEGIEYNPLAKEDPDITLSAAERQIGGLGIFIVKKMVDDALYKREDGKNIFTLTKKMTS